MNWMEIKSHTKDGEEAMVHVHLSVKKRNQLPGEGVDYRLLKFSVLQFWEYSEKIITYAIENKVYCAAHFLCGCSKKFVLPGDVVSEDEKLDVLCDEHWKQEVLGIPAEVYFVK